MYYGKLKGLPLGSLTAEGFLKEQLLRSKNGMGGHLDELEPEMIAAPYVDRKYVKAWGDGDQAGWGAEISGNYWTGLIELAFSLGDAELIQKATTWVDAVLKNQCEDGYLGTYIWESDDIYDDYNAWGTTCGMRGLIAFYEATGRKDVLDAVERCMLWFCDKWSGDKKTCYAGSFIIEAMVFCYHHTGNEALIKFAEEYSDFLCTHDIFKTSYKAYLEEDLQYNSDHTAGMGIHTRLPALLYTATGKKEYLKASEKILDEVYQKATHLSGSPVSVAEYLAPVTSTAETEYCSYAFFNTTYFYMSYITGNSKYGDRLEEMFYNGAQGARKKDEKVIAYLNSPNQIYATENSSPIGGDWQVYAPCYPTSCCPVNAVAVLGGFVRSMMLTDDSDNIYINAYGPCKLNYKNIEIEEITEYPFRNQVQFKVKTKKSFDIFLRIPGWCKEYTIRKNRQKIYAEKAANGFARLENIQTGDVICISFREDIQILRVNDDFKKHPIAIKRGALLYAFHIQEVWSKTDGHPTTPLPDNWSWYKAEPYFEEADRRDAHERLGMRRNMINWNFAIDENISADDIDVELVDTDDYVWESAKVKLHLNAYKAPYLCALYPVRTIEPYEDKQTVTEKINITLVPYGCTNLRITYFPIADL